MHLGKNLLKQFTTNYLNLHQVVHSHKMAVRKKSAQRGSIAISYALKIVLNCGYLFF